MLTGGSCKNVKTGVTWDLLEDLVRKLYAAFWTTPKKSYNGIDVIKACIIISISACDTVGLSFAIFLSWKKKNTGMNHMLWSWNDSVTMWLCERTHLETFFIWISTAFLRCYTGVDISNLVYCLIVPTQIWTDIKQYNISTYKAAITVVSVTMSCI